MLKSVCFKRRSVLTLQQCSITTLLISLWSTEKIRNLIEYKLRFMFETKKYEEWELVEDEIVKDIKKLQLPKKLEKKLAERYRLVGLELAAWVEYHFVELKFNQIPKNLCWTSKGTIDREKTAKILVQNEILEIYDRYRLACAYCFEDDIKSLWKLVKLIQPNGHENELTLFWRLYNDKETNPIAELHWDYKKTFKMFKQTLLYSAKTGNISATKYFFRKTIESLEEVLMWQEWEDGEEEVLPYIRWDFIPNILATGFFRRKYYSDFIIFLLTEINCSDYDDFRSTDYFFFEKFFRRMVMWPFQDVLIETLQSTMEIFPDFRDFEGVFHLIFRKIADKFDDYDYIQLYKTLWALWPENSKVRYEKDLWSTWIPKVLNKLAIDHNYSPIFIDLDPFDDFTDKYEISFENYFQMASFFHKDAVIKFLEMYKKKNWKLSSQYFQWALEKEKPAWYDLMARIEENFKKDDKEKTLDTKYKSIWGNERYKSEEYYSDGYLVQSISGVRNVLKVGKMFIPSLQQCSIRATLTALWSTDEILNLIDSKMKLIFYNENYATWEVIEEKIVENIKKLPLPKGIKNKYANHFRNVGLELAAWIEYHLVQLKIKRRIPKNLCWTSYGTIDRERTAKVLIEDDRLDVYDRYKLACAYCLEDSIKVLWESVKDCEEESEDELVLFWRLNYGGKLQNPLAELYWDCYDNPFERLKKVFIHSVKTGNITATKYFFKKIRDEEKLDLCIILECVHNFLSTRFFQKKYLLDFALFSLTDLKDLPYEYCLRGSYSPYWCFAYPDGYSDSLRSYFQQFFESMVKWPFQDMLIETLSSIWEFVPDFDQFTTVFNEIHTQMFYGHDDYDYIKLYKVLWALWPDDSKKKNSHHLCPLSLQQLVYKFANDNQISPIFINTDLINDNILNMTVSYEEMEWLSDFQIRVEDFFGLACLFEKNVVLRFLEMYKEKISKEYNVTFLSYDLELKKKKDEWYDRLVYVEEFYRRSEEDKTLDNKYKKILGNYKYTGDYFTDLRHGAEDSSDAEQIPVFLADYDNQFLNCFFRNYFYDPDSDFGNSFLQNFFYESDSDSDYDSDSDSNRPGSLALIFECTTLD